MPDEFIAENGTDLTDAFRSYLWPLLGRGMPVAGRLRHHAVPRISGAGA
jgi:6-phosphofructokinase 1